MKYLIVTFLLASTSCAYSQVDFSAYGRITNSDFQAYVDLFPEQSLPVSSDYLIGSDLIKPSVPNIPENMVENYLKDNGNYIVPSLYELELETGETSDRYGYFQPVYRLPTDGDYLLLVVYQWDARSEWAYRAVVLTYDLNGNFIKSVGSGYLIDGSAPYVSTSINADLEFTHTYVTNVSSSSSDFFQCKPCNRSYQTDVYRILNSGLDSLQSSTDHGIASFMYVPFYFKKQP